MATMARTSDIEEAAALFKLSVIIFESPLFTPLVKKALSSVAVRCGLLCLSYYNLVKLISFGSVHIFFSLCPILNAGWVQMSKRF